MAGLDLERLFMAWRDAALLQWQRVVEDVDNSDIIQSYFQEVGWGSWIKGRYRNTRRNAWCGVFAAYCGLTLGECIHGEHEPLYMLDYEVARMVLPSTYRLTNRHKWAAAGVPVPTIMSGNILKDPWEVLAPGMVATVATRNGPSYGGHIVIIDDFDDRTGRLDTIEGNGWGELGNGKYGEGVIRRRGKRARHISELRALPLFSDAHFDVILNFDFDFDEQGRQS